MTKTTSHDPEEWLTAAQAAAVIKVPVKYLYREIKSGALRASRISQRRTRIRHCDLNEYFNRRAIG